MRNLKKLFGISLLLAVVSLANVPALAATKQQVKNAKATAENLSNSVTHSYNADKSVQLGMLVQLKPDDPKTIIPLDSKNVKNMLGVAIPSSNATIVLTPEKVEQQQTLVATTGHYSVLVSNQAGPIKVGDYVTASAIDGVAMKADEDQEQIVGKAAGNFTGTSNVIGTVKLKDSFNRENTIALGRIPVDINISHNPLFTKTVDYVPGFLAKVAVTVANHPVSVARIYLCMAVLAITAVLAGNMIYSGIRSGMIAVGRNPLSKKSIIKSLIQTVIASLIIFVAGVLAVYLLLKL